MGLKDVLLCIKNESYSCCVLFLNWNMLWKYLSIYSLKWKTTGVVIIIHLDWFLLSQWRLCSFWKKSPRPKVLMVLEACWTLKAPQKQKLQSPFATTDKEVLCSLETFLEEIISFFSWKVFFFNVFFFLFDISFFFFFLIKMESYW